MGDTTHKPTRRDPLLVKITTKDRHLDYEASKIRDLTRAQDRDNILKTLWWAARNNKTVFIEPTEPNTKTDV